jgi:hypothetical protein
MGLKDLAKRKLLMQELHTVDEPSDDEEESASDEDEGTEEESASDEESPDGEEESASDEGASDDEEESASEDEDDTAKPDFLKKKKKKVKPGAFGAKPAPGFAGKLDESGGKGKGMNPLKLWAKVKGGGGQDSDN